MGDEEETMNPREMVVDVGSPTEVAEESDDADLAGEKDEKKVKLEKRKREARQQQHGRARAVPEDSDHELDSPSKRPSMGERPITARELRGLLAGHVAEMKGAWGEFQNRLDKVEFDQARASCAVQDLQARTVVAEKDIAAQRQTAQEHTTTLDNLAAEVTKMKVRIEELHDQPRPQAGQQQGNAAAVANSSDPWAEFLRRSDAGQRPGGDHAKGVRSADECA